MFKLFVMLGVIILFNVLSRKIGNLDKDLEKDPLSSSDNDMDKVWANLAKLAQEKKNAANQVKEDIDRRPIYSVVKKTTNVSLEDEQIANISFSDIDMPSEDFSTYEENVFESKQDKNIFSASYGNEVLKEEDLCLPSVHAEGENKHDFFKNSFEELKEDKVFVDSAVQERVMNKKELIFSKNPVLNGIVFSEILDKPKSKR